MLLRAASPTSGLDVRYTAQCKAYLARVLRRLGEVEEAKKLCVTVLHDMPVPPGNSTLTQGEVVYQLVQEEPVRSGRQDTHNDVHD